MTKTVSTSAAGLSRRDALWPFSTNETAATGLLVAFWLGVAIGICSVKGGVL